jgi:hypothetical protein
MRGKYLENTSELVLRLLARDPLVMELWIECSFAVHNNMQSHTGSTMSMGTGSIWSSSIMQKQNTRRSTEAELVSVNDIMPQILGTRYFLIHEGLNIGPSRILQNNKNAILLEENRMASSFKRTCHIHIKFCLVTYQIHLNNLSIEHSPTKSVVADFFTKPLQGSAFYEFKKLIMGLSD